MNPVLEYRVQFTALKTSPELLTYLQSSALVLELWGLQGEQPVPSPHLHTCSLSTEYAGEPTYSTGTGSVPETGFTHLV